NDVMYCVGRKSDGKWVLDRYDNLLASKDTTPHYHAAPYVLALTQCATDITMLAYPTPDPSYAGYMGMALAGDKVFIADMWGPICGDDGTLGSDVTPLTPGPEGAAIAGLDDVAVGVTAFKRSTGESLFL